MNDDTGNVSLSNSTISGNSAAGWGGGIFCSFDSLALANSTISGNRAAMGGGGLSYTSASGARAVLHNSIIAGNFAAGAATADDIAGTFIDTSQSRFNLIGTGGSGGLVTGVNGNIVGVADPKLAPLGDYGGPTQTMPPLAGSPAIDAGSNAMVVGPDGKPLLTDQRGYYRIFNGAVDIGAVEYGSLPLLPGDADGDGKVDFADLVILARNYGNTSATWSDGDFNNDGSVGFDDLVIVARNYGKSVSLAATAAMFSTSVVGAPPTSSPAALFDVSGLAHHRRQP